jgi:spastin
LDPDVVK